MIRLAALSIISLYLVLNTIDAAPLQTLPQKPGYVPVYIRYGDTPLEEINPGLAVAFREFGGEARNFRDSEQMLADEAPKSSSESESKEEKGTTKAPLPEDGSSESKSVEKDNKEKEEPKALPVKKETENKKKVQ